MLTSLCNSPADLHLCFLHMNETGLLRCSLIISHWLVSLHIPVDTCIVKSLCLTNVEKCTEKYITLKINEKEAISNAY